MRDLPAMFNDNLDELFDDMSMIFKIVTGMGLKKFSNFHKIEFNSYKDLYRHLDYDQLLAATVLMTNNSQFDRAKVAKPLRKYLLAHMFVENFPELIDEEDGIAYLDELSKKVKPEMLVY